MKSTKEFNKRVLSAIFDNLPWSLRECSRGSGLGVGTLSGWKQGKHSPRGSSWELFLEYLVNELPEENKRNMFEAILNIGEINIKGNERKELASRKEENFAAFLNYMLTDYDFRGSYAVSFQELDSERVEQIVCTKLERWLEAVKGPVGIEKKGGIGSRRIICVTFKREELPIYYSVMSFSLKKEDDKTLETSLENVKNIFTDRFCHIALSFDKISDSRYMTLLRKYDAYVIGIEDSDFQEYQTYDAFLDLRDYAKPGQVLQLNYIGEVLYKKILASFYLVYKELLCCRYDFNKVTDRFFKTNGGIGEYPYAMRREISFEKKLLGRKLENLERKRGKKADLIIDLNCIGGIYGMRLCQYTKRVLCIDTSVNALETIQRIVGKYNEQREEQMPEIANINTALFREETMEIMDNTDWHGKADCIVMGLGAFSFAKNQEQLLRKVEGWLKKDGFVLISVCNADALSIAMNRYENLNYVYDRNYNRFIYDRGWCRWPVPVRLFSFREFKNLILKYFDTSPKESWSYPILTSIFAEEQYQSGIGIIKEMDKASALYREHKLYHGIYNIIKFTHYPKRPDSDIYRKAKKKISDKDIACRIITHSEFYSLESLIRALYSKNIIITNNFIKSVLLKESCENGMERYLFILAPINKKLNIHMLEKERGIKEAGNIRGRIKFCKQKELMHMGFMTGSISPFAYLVLKKEYQMELLYDESILRLPYDVIYTYTGDCESTYEIQWEEFCRYLRMERAGKLDLK